jgi:hypothetical protein
MSPQDRPSGCIATCLAAVWIIWWTFGTLLFDGMLAWGIFWQLTATTYPSVPGVITKSEVLVDHDSDGTRGRPDLEYTYMVGGVEYRGTAYRYPPFNKPTPDWEDFVQLAVTEIRHFGGASIQVARRLRAKLENLMQTLPEERAALLRQELELLHCSAERFFTEPEDRALADISDLQGVGGKQTRSQQGQAASSGQSEG